MAMEEEDLYTKDGTFSYRGNPAKRNETGTWKACPFILGTTKTPFVVAVCLLSVLCLDLEKQF